MAIVWSTIDIDTMHSRRLRLRGEKNCQTIVIGNVFSILSGQIPMQRRQESAAIDGNTWEGLLETKGVDMSCLDLSSIESMEFRSPVLIQVLNRVFSWNYRS